LLGHLSKNSINLAARGRWWWCGRGDGYM